MGANGRLLTGSFWKIFPKSRRSFINGHRRIESCVDHHQRDEVSIAYHRRKFARSEGTQIAAEAPRHEPSGGLRRSGSLSVHFLRHVASNELQILYGNAHSAFWRVPVPKVDFELAFDIHRF